MLHSDHVRQLVYRGYVLPVFEGCVSFMCFCLYGWPDGSGHRDRVHPLAQGASRVCMKVYCVLTYLEGPLI